MKLSSLALISMLSLAALPTLGCKKKEADKAATQPATGPTAGTTPPAATPPAAAPAAEVPAATPPAAKKVVELLPECKEFTALFDALVKCPKLADQSAQMKEGYDQMLKAMTDLGDQKAMVDGCKMGMDSLRDALKTAGC